MNNESPDAPKGTAQMSEVRIARVLTSDIFDWAAPASTCSAAEAFCGAAQPFPIFCYGVIRWILRMRSLWL
jgi:hypothetical protein